MRGTKAKMLRRIATEICKSDKLAGPSKYKKVYKALKKNYKS